MGPLESSSMELKVADLLNADTRDWNEELVCKLLSNEASDILCIKPSKTGATGTFCWLPTLYGEYTTKTGYYSALKQLESTEASAVTSQPCDWMKDIWLLPLPPKLRVFLCKIVRGALPLGDNLETRGITDNSKCIFCGLKETANHLFLSCDFAKSIWSLAPILHGPSLATTTDFTVALQASRKMPNLPPTGVKIGSLFPWIVWSIWTTRNQRIFENRHFTGRETLRKSTADAREWEEAQTDNTQQLATPHSRTPQPQLNSGVLIVHTDAAWREETKTAGMAWIFTDSNGHIIHQGSKTEE
ncbi:hypothetical protein Bca4012_038876 [Brassica carinata]